MVMGAEIRQGNHQQPMVLTRVASYQRATAECTHSVASNILVTKRLVRIGEHRTIKIEQTAGTHSLPYPSVLRANVTKFRY